MGYYVSVSYQGVDLIVVDAFSVHLLETEHDLQKVSNVLVVSCLRKNLCQALQPCTLAQ
jgi:hypothetical protein